VNETARSVATLELQSLFTNSRGTITLALDSSDIDHSLAAGEALFAVTDSADVGSATQQMLTLVVLPQSLGNYTVTLAGSDETGRRANVIVWNFEVLRRDTAIPAYGPHGLDCDHGTRVDTIPFDHSYECNCHGTVFTGDNCEDEDQPQLVLETNYEQFVPAGDTASALTFYNRTKWGWDTTYQLAPFNLTRAYTVFISGGTPSQREHNITYTLDWGSNIAPRGFYVDGSTGEALIRIPRDRLNLTARLMVGAAGLRSAVAANLTFTLLPTDVDADSDAVGPGGQDCANDGVRTDTYDGESEFDGHFTCTCASAWTGPNCENNLAAASAAGTASSLTTAYAVVGALVAVILVAIAVARYQVIHADAPVTVASLRFKAMSSLYETFLFLY